MSHISVRPLDDEEWDLIQSLMNLAVSGPNQAIAKISPTVFANVTFGTSAGTITGSGTANQFAYFTGATTIASSENALFDGNNIGIPATTSIVGQFKQAGKTLFHTFGTSNTFFGINCGNLTTTGAGFNQGFGNTVLNSLTTGNSNVASGSFCLNSTTTGSSNTAMGVSALSANITGSSLVAFGRNAAKAVTAGVGIVAIGAGALAAETGSVSGGRSTAIGASALVLQNGADLNTAIGRSAGSSVTTGSNLILIGDQAGTANGATAITTENGILLIGHRITLQIPGSDNQMSIANVLFAKGTFGTGTTISSATIGLGGLPTSGKVTIPTAPVASANYGTLNIGSGAFDGSTTGKFVGSASGTSLAINEVSGYAGNLADLQIAGVQQMTVMPTKTYFRGNVTIGTTVGNPNSYSQNITISSASQGAGTNSSMDIEGYRTGGNQLVAAYQFINNGSNIALVAAWRDDADDHGYITFYTRDSVGSNERMRIGRSGNITFSTAPDTSVGTYDILTRNISTGLMEKIVSASIPIVVATTFEKAETGTDANVLTYTTNASIDEFLTVQVATDISALTGTSVAVTVTWKDSNNATATSSITLSGVGDGTINIPINALKNTNVVVSTVFVGVSTAYNISAMITRIKPLP